MSNNNVSQLLKDHAIFASVSEARLDCITEYHVVKYGTPKHKVRKIQDSILVDDNADVRAAWDGATLNAAKNFVHVLDMLAASMVK